MDKYPDSSTLTWSSNASIEESSSSPVILMKGSRMVLSFNLVPFLILLCPFSCFSFVNVNSILEFRIIGDAWAFDKLQTRNFSELIYFLVMKVDKTKLGKDVHENNDNIDKNEPGPASDVIENKIEAFKLLASLGGISY